MTATTSDMHGRTVLVTGGTGGIGLATATGLAALGARVGIVGRSAVCGYAAADAIRRTAPSAHVDVFEANLSSQAEVRRLAEKVRTAYDTLDVLVNNAGGYGRTGMSQPMASSTPSPSITWPRSCSPTKYETYSSAALRRGS